MFDLESFRLRVLTAMGIAVATSSACGAPSNVPVTSDTKAAGDATLSDADASAPIPDVSDATIDADISTKPDAGAPPDAIPDSNAPTCDSGKPAYKQQYDAAGVKAGMTQYLCHGSPKDQMCDGGWDAGSSDAASPPPCTKTYDGPLPPTGCPSDRFMVHTCQDIAKVEVVGDTCVYWICEPCVCGRPWLVAGVARKAALVEQAASGGDAEARTHATHLELLAEAWRHDAQDEHASIASFSQFTLELLSFAAPADLVQDAIRAAGDEVHHTQLGLDLAKQLDGRAFDPGALSCLDVVLARDLAEAAAMTVRAGCVGETVAAVVANTAARHATEPAFAVALRKIADDELRHAELAWRFVRWACETGGEDVQRAVRQAFAQALAAQPRPDVRHTMLAEVPDTEQHRYGRLPAGEFTKLAHSVLHQVVAPCARDLLGGSAVKIAVAA